MPKISQMELASEPAVSSGSSLPTKPPRKLPAISTGSLGWWVGGVGCGVWGVGCGVWGVGCGVWGVGCGVWGVGCGVGWDRMDWMGWMDPVPLNGLAWNPRLTLRPHPHISPASLLRVPIGFDLVAVQGCSWLVWDECWAC